MNVWKEIIDLLLNLQCLSLIEAKIFQTIQFSLSTV